MPRQIIERASEILEDLESKSIEADGNESQESRKSKLSLLSTKPGYQLSIFDAAPDPIAAELKEIISSLNINGMTPIDCMMKLNELKKKIEEQ
jgi:DNA mismatch repair protein MutS